MEIKFSADNVVNDIKAECVVYSQDVCRRASSLMADEMVEAYKTIIDQWYAEYTPLVYKRHEVRYNSINKRGMYKSFKRIRRNPHDSVYTVGIDYLSIDTMYNDYNIPSSDVLDMFLKGWHGNSDLKFSPTTPKDELISSVNKIAANTSTYIKLGENYARSLRKYDYLYF